MSLREELGKASVEPDARPARPRGFTWTEVKDAGSTAFDPPPVPHKSILLRRAEAEALRKKTPHRLHLGWKRGPNVRDPIDLIIEQNATRDVDLVPVRHKRMAYSAFTFYRGSARVMANDLGDSPTSGLPYVWLSGDCHLLNFGMYASPERKLILSVKDFDETLRGPFEFDLKRLVASFVIAARHNKFPEEVTLKIATHCARCYRQAMHEFSSIGELELWYKQLPVSEIEEFLTERAHAHSLSVSGKKKKKKDKKTTAHQSSNMPWSTKLVEKARNKGPSHALDHLAEAVDEDSFRIVSEPPLIVPLRDWSKIYPDLQVDVDQLELLINAARRRYRSSLQADRRELLERFRFVDAARKVVGVGSVGTRCFVVLLMGSTEKDPLFLQLKEATKSVLEDVLPSMNFSNQGERVITGQRMMQASSDIFLGYSGGLMEKDRNYYWRQLRDMKGKIDSESMSAEMMENYAHITGWTLAKAHARSGDRVGMAEYMGRGTSFEEAIADFGFKYADQVAKDYDAFISGIQTGRVVT